MRPELVEQFAKSSQEKNSRNQLLNDFDTMLYAAEKKSSNPVVKEIFLEAQKWKRENENSHSTEISKALNEFKSKLSRYL